MSKIVKIIEKVKKNKEEFIVGSIFLLFAFGFNTYRVVGDGELYYSFLEYILGQSDNFSRGFFQAGCAYFNAPFYFLACIVEKLLRLNWNFNGITLRTIAINLASNFYLLLSIVLTIKILKRFNFKSIILPVLAVLFSTSAFVAGIITPSYNHAVDIFVNTLFIYLLLKDTGKHSYLSFCLGNLMVLAILVRYFNVILIIPALIYYLKYRQHRKAIYFLIGFISFAWVIPLILFNYNGGCFSLFYRQGDSKEVLSYIFLLPKYLLKYLVHPLHGLFVWSPVLIFSAFGLSIFSKAKDRLGYFFIGIWFLFLAVYGFFPSWYGGWSFSNRYLVNLFPIYCIGLASFIQRYGKKIIPIVVGSVFYSLFLFFNWYICVIDGQFGTPFNMFEAWIKGESPGFYGGKINISIFWNRIWETCRYKYIFRIL